MFSLLSRLAGRSLVRTAGWSRLEERAMEYVVSIWIS